MSKALEEKMKRADSYATWREAAMAHDKRSGAQAWREEEKSNRYDYLSIRSKLDTLQEMRTKNDNNGLLFSLNEGIHGNLGGMGRAELYQHATFGTQSFIP
jgi:hypothetical protein